MHLAAFLDVLDLQAGAISRGQLLAGGAQRHDIDRWLRRRDLNQVLPSVYVNHTGDLTLRQRFWAAVLFAEPCALAWTSAVRAAGGRPTRLAGRWGEEHTVHLLVGPGRHLVTPPWIVLHRTRALSSSVLWSTRPPRQRPEPAAVDVAVAHLRSGARDAHLQAVAALADPLEGRRTTVDRMLTEIDGRRRLAHRRWITGVVEDIATGATSVLEQGFLERVERAHGLPGGQRQVVHDTASGTAIRDTLYLGRRVVELDGRQFHQGAAQRDLDLERDLDAALTGLSSTRLGWAQVFDRPCSTAGKVGTLLAAHGWDGRPYACGPACPAPSVFHDACAQRFRSASSGAAERNR